MQIISLTGGNSRNTKTVQTAVESKQTLYCSTTANAVGNKGREDLFIYLGYTYLQSEKEHRKLYRARCEGYKLVLEATKHIGHIPTLLSLPYQVAKQQLNDLDSDGLR